jgi:hydrogenase maturation factor
VTVPEAMELLIQRDTHCIDASDLLMSVISGAKSTKFSPNNMVFCHRTGFEPVDVMESVTDSQTVQRGAVIGNSV